MADLPWCDDDRIRTGDLCRDKAALWTWLSYATKGLERKTARTPVRGGRRRGLVLLSSSPSRPIADVVNGQHDGARRQLPDLRGGP